MKNAQATYFVVGRAGGSSMRMGSRGGIVVNVVIIWILKLCHTITKITPNSGQAKWNEYHDVSSVVECEKLAMRLRVNGPGNMRTPHRP